MPKTYLKRCLLNSLLNTNIVLIAISTLLILSIERNGIRFVSSNTVPTPYPDANARPTITSKLENFSESHRTTAPSNSNTSATTEGYLNINGNDSYGKFSLNFAHSVRISKRLNRFHVFTIEQFIWNFSVYWTYWNQSGVTVLFYYQTQFTHLYLVLVLLLIFCCCRSNQIPFKLRTNEANKKMLLWKM